MSFKETSDLTTEKIDLESLRLSRRKKYHAKTSQPMKKEAMELWPKENHEIVKHQVTFMGDSTEGVSIPFIGRKNKDCEVTFIA